MGQPIDAEQFTTLENTPIEFLVHGADATQSYAADGFALGLCVLHLLVSHLGCKLMIGVAARITQRRARVQRMQLTAICIVPRVLLIGWLAPRLGPARTRRYCATSFARRS